MILEIGWHADAQEFRVRSIGCDLTDEQVIKNRGACFYSTNGKQAPLTWALRRHEAWTICANLHNRGARLKWVGELHS